MSTYLDGREVASFTRSGSVDNKATWIGGQSRTSWSTSYFNGRIAHFAVYQDALSDEQIEGHFDASGYAPEPDGPTVPYEDLVLDADPVAYWRLGGTSTADDDASGNGNHATTYGGVTVEASGALADDEDTAITLNGSSGYLQAPTSSSLNSPSTAITMEAWIRPASGAFGGQRPLLIKGYTSHANPYYQYGLFVRDDTQYPRAIGVSLTANGTHQGATLPYTGWTYGEWHHVVATYDGSSARIYVNGVLRGAVAVSGTLNTYTTPVTLGAYANLAKTSANLFNGDIDEVAIYATALSAATIDDHYTLGVEGPRYVPPGLECPDPLANNSLGAAEPLVGSVVDRSLCNGEADWYQVEVSSGDLVVADLFIEGQGELQLALRDSIGELIDASPTSELLATLTYEVTTPGTVYLEVSEDSNASSVYSLAASHRPPGACGTSEDALEPNDQRSAASPLGVTPLQGYVCDAPDVFVITVPPSTAALTVDLAFEHDDGDLDLALYDHTGDAIDTSTGTADTETVAATAPPEGDYYLEVYGYQGAPGAYDITAVLS